MGKWTFRLCLPFTTQPQYDMGSAVTEFVVPLPDLNASFKGSPGSYVLEVDGFESVESALAFIPRAWLGLTSLMLDIKTGLVVNLDARESAVEEVGEASGLPVHFHGPRAIVDEGWPYIAPSGAKLISVSAGKVGVHLAVGSERAVRALGQGMTHPRAKEFFDERRFRTAVDLFAEAPFEERNTSRLILLATALEVLAPPIPKHEAALSFLRRWKEELEEALATHPVTSDEAASLESLKGEIIHRHDASIRTRIRYFVRSTFAEASILEADLLAKQAVSAYDDRSILVHDGSLPERKVSAAIEVLRQTLERLFLIRLGVT